MARRTSLTSLLFKLARASADAKAVSSGRLGRRIKNKVLGRALAKMGFWRKLWG